MILTSTAILRKTPLFLPHSLILSPPPPNFNSISANPLQKFNSILSKRELGFTGLNYKYMGQRHSRISAVSGGGSGGSTGGNGGGGFGGSGNDGVGGDGGNQSKWSLLSWYMDLLLKSPVLTKAVTSALLNFVGDLICQLAIDKVPTPDYKRTSMFTFLGLVLVGPTLHYWYLYLSKLVTLPGASGAFLRLILDQFIFAPIFIGTFLSTLITLEGRPSQVAPKLKQVLASNFVAVIWNVILSYKAHKEVVTK
ncbi:protein sym-1-like isoform X2 [Chenopodium quinoa]|uniref:protein sym-1-like isoform X2 n=1 Tax=Chenopodium quinoa TaxID=63459 RepID=UPI000B77C85B|nr:protein sym-1-like isoform X2 [Chenopodium quinoa]